MIDDDLHQLSQVLAQAVRAAPHYRREIERTLRVGSGRLNEVLSGATDLKVESLTRLARLLRIPPGDLLAAGCPEATRNARYRLADWLGSAEPASSPPAAPPTAEEVAEMVRTAVREELQARLKT